MKDDTLAAYWEAVGKTAEEIGAILRRDAEIPFLRVAERDGLIAQLERVDRVSPRGLTR